MFIIYSRGKCKSVIIIINLEIGLAMSYFIIIAKKKNYEEIAPIYGTCKNAIIQMRSAYYMQSPYLYL